MSLPETVATERLDLRLVTPEDAQGMLAGRRRVSWHPDYPRPDDQDAAAMGQLLPPGLAGHRPICPFTAGRSPTGGWTAPDLARAERLVAASGTRGTTVEVWAYKSRYSVGRHLVDVLRSLGFRAHLRKFDDIYPAYQAAIDPRQRPQIGLTDWIAEGVSPTTFIRPLVACDGYVPRDETTTNLTRFCDPGLDAEIDQVHAAEPVVGNRLQRIERRIARAAPVVPLRNDRWLAVASARVGNVQFHPLTGVLLDQIWVR